jgi:hypothetical protein
LTKSLSTPTRHTACPNIVEIEEMNMNAIPPTVVTGEIKIVHNQGALLPMEGAPYDDRRYEILH